MTLSTTLKELAERATKGQWLTARATSVLGRGIVAAPSGRMIATIVEHESEPSNAALIVELVNALPTIIAALEAVELVPDGVAGVAGKAFDALTIIRNCADEDMVRKVAGDAADMIAAILAIREQDND